MQQWCSLCTCAAGAAGVAGAAQAARRQRGAPGAARSRAASGARPSRSWQQLMLHRGTLWMAAARRSTRPAPAVSLLQPLRRRNSRYARRRGGQEGAQWQGIRRCRCIRRRTSICGHDHHITESRSSSALRTRPHAAGHIFVVTGMPGCWLPMQAAWLFVLAHAYTHACCALP